MTRWAQEGWQAWPTWGLVGKNPRVTAPSWSGLTPLCPLTGSGPEDLREENGVYGYAGRGVALWEAPGKKEGFLECEAHGDLEDLEETLKKFFLAES